MPEDKITVSISKKNLLITLIILLLLFLPFPSYGTLPTPCPLIYPGPPCPTKIGWVLTKPLFFRIIDFIKYNLSPQPPTGLEEPGESTTVGGTIDSVSPQ